MNAQTNAGAWLGPFYIALAVVGLVGSWAQVLGMLPLGFIGATSAFWKEALTTPSSTFLVVDILVLAAVAFTWLFGECRRLGMSAGWAWFYFAGSTLIAISCFFPLFMAHRERQLRQRGATAAPQGSDLIGVALAVATALAGAAYSLTHIPA